MIGLHNPLSSMSVQSIVTALIVCVCALPGGSSGGVPLSDGVEGVTCRLFAVGYRLAWQRVGGDWIDDEGEMHGEVAIAQQRLGSGDGEVIFDMTKLLKDTVEKGQQELSVFIRGRSVQRRGSVSFHSRETGDRLAAPTLEIEWTDGSQSSHIPFADSFLTCSTHKSVGARPALKVGPDDSTIIAFALPETQGERRVKQASLRLTVSRAPRAAFDLAVFRAVLPSLGRTAPQSGIASTYKSDLEIERHPAVILAERFDNEGWESRWSDRSRGNNVELVEQDPDNLMRPLDGKALKVTVAKGKLIGLNMRYRLATAGMGEPEEMYFRYYLRLGENWNPTTSGGKLPGFAGTYDRAGWGGRRADGVNGWSARGIFFQTRGEGVAPGNRRGIGSYVYHVGMEGDHGSAWGWGLGKTGALEKNRWYSVEQYVKLNTPGQADGVLRAWIDGELAFENTQLRFRDVAELRIETLWMNVYHGGTETAPNDLSLYIDNLVIAREYIGPAVFGN